MFLVPLFLLIFATSIYLIEGYVTCGYAYNQYGSSVDCAFKSITCDACNSTKSVRDVTITLVCADYYGDCYSMLQSMFVILKDIDGNVIATNQKNDGTYANVITFRPTSCSTMLVTRRCNSYSYCYTYITFASAVVDNGYREVGAITQFPSFSPTPEPTLAPTTNQVFSAEALKERKALLSIWRTSFGACDFPEWKRSDNWATNADVSYWYGVTVNDDGRVVGLSLADNGIYASVPHSLLNDLEYLQYVDISNNAFYGTLPNMSSGALLDLRLAGNKFTGTISELFIGSLKKTFIVDISHNGFSSTIPSELSLMTTLAFLDLSDNFFSAANNELVLDEILPLTSLVDCSLAFNNFNSSLKLSHSDYNLDIVNVRNLYLSNNLFRGEIDSRIFLLPALVSLDLSHNLFSGNISLDANITQIPLVSVDFSYNLISGSIPDALCSLRHLKVLYMQQNSISCYPSCLDIYLFDSFGLPICYGDQDIGLCALGKIISPYTAARVGTQLFSTSIQPRIGNYQDKTVYFREYVYKTPSIPDVNKIYVSFDKNILLNPYDEITVCGGPHCYSFQGLNAHWPGVAHNPNLTFTSSTVNVTVGAISYRDISNDLSIRPDMFQYAITLIGVSAATAWECSNSSIPDVMEPTLYPTLSPTQGVTLYPSYLGTSGSTYGSTSGSTSSDTSGSTNSYYTGSPTFWPTTGPPTLWPTSAEPTRWPTTPEPTAWPTTASPTADSTPDPTTVRRVLKARPITRDKSTIIRVPSSRGVSSPRLSIQPKKVHQLDVLSEQGGEFLARAACSWTGVSCYYHTSVTSISVESLSVVGTIPTEIGLLTHLNTLSLNGNSFSGTLPTELGLLTNLQILNLGGNELRGTIPIEFAGLTNLVSLTLEDNYISGTIPDVLYELPKLAEIKLRTNYLSGTLSSSFTTMNSLKIVELDSNYFSGTFPDSLCTPNITLSLSDNGYLCRSSKCFYKNIVLGSTAQCAGPSSPKASFWTSTTIGIISAAGVLVLIMLAMYVFLWRSRRIRYFLLPIHNAILFNSTLSMESFQAKLLTAQLLDYQHCNALDLYIQVHKSCTILSEEMLYQLLIPGLPYRTEDSEPIPEDEHRFGWSKVVQVDDDLVFAVINRVLRDFEGMAQLLAEATDEHHRRSVDIACPRNREAICRSLYLHRRYELKAGPPEHKSATAVVLFAMDFGAEIIGQSSSGTGMGVALKLMKNRSQFLGEIRIRETAKFDSAFVVGIHRSYDGDAEDEDNVRFRLSAIKKGYQAYPYCLVMDIADINLKRIIDQQNIVASDWDQIRIITKNLAMALGHIHSKGIVHGDLKPLNVVKVMGTLRIIDLDASVSFSDDFHQCAGSKYSSAYLPPELYYLPPTGPPAIVRTFVTDPATALPMDSECSYDAATNTYTHLTKGYQLYSSHWSIDMWALGALLYLMCTGLTLFQASVEDNFQAADMIHVCNWTDELKEEKLNIVKDKYARNLLSLLLSKDPKMRPDANHVITHPFLTGHEPIRLQGEIPAFDVFLSYRVDSDSDHVEMLYLALKQRGLKVWWDKKCLEPGQRWEDGFCDGLVNSLCFVCLLSKNAINHPSKPWQNMNNLEAGSRCDNVLLEWRLALELNQRNMIEGVFPVFIGDKIVDAATGGISYSDYFPSGCHPNGLPNVSVTAVEAKLREHLNRQSLGSPYHLTHTVRDIAGDITANQGAFWRGSPEPALNMIVDEVVKMKELLTRERGVRNKSAKKAILSAESNKEKLSVSARTNHMVSAFPLASSPTPEPTLAKSRNPFAKYTKIVPKVRSIIVASAEAQAKASQGAN